MRKAAFAVMAVLLAALFVASVQASQQTKEAAKASEKKAPKHSYVGVSKCGMCHKAEAKGDQLGHWQKSRHSQAYAVLATDAAKETAKKAGIEGDPQKSAKCLKCHVTAYGAEKDLLGPKYSMEDGVGCESCHGPGGDYMKMSVMKNKEEAVAAGLVVPTEEVCIKCHNEESPSYKKFVYKEMVAKVAHPRPKAE